jgi:histone deacetylase complex regulatory component SIN3
MLRISSPLDSALSHPAQARSILGSTPQSTSTQGLSESARGHFSDRNGRPTSEQIQGLGWVEPKQTEFRHAIRYLNTVKGRYASDAEARKQLRKALQAYKVDKRNAENVCGGPAPVDEAKHEAYPF